MKNDKDFCILSVKYSIIDTSAGENDKVGTTEMERVFVARKKSTVMKKIRKFESRLTAEKQPPKKNFIQRGIAYVRHFMDTYRYSYQQLIKL